MFLLLVSAGGSVPRPTPMTERTREELADALDAGQMIAFLAGVKGYYYRNQELTNRVGRHIDEIITRLREMDGERIEGFVLVRDFEWGREMKDEAKTVEVPFKTFKLWESETLERPATLILNPQEPNGS